MTHYRIGAMRYWLRFMNQKFLHVALRIYRFRYRFSKRETSPTLVIDVWVIRA